MEDAAGHLKAQYPTVSRYETGEVLPVWSTVHMLLTFYDATEEDLAQAAPFLAPRNTPVGSAAWSWTWRVARS